MPTLATFRESLTIKLLAIYMATVGTSIALLMGGLEIRSYTEERQSLSNSLRQLMEVQSAALTVAVWELDRKQVQAVLENMSGLESLQSAVVRDETGSVIAAIGNSNISAEAPDLQANRTLIQNAFGDFDVTFTTAPIWRELVKRLQVSAIILITVIVALSAVTVFITRHIIGRPLHALRHSIESLSKDNKLVEIDWKSSDELGQVISAYNMMQSEVKHHREHLESIVAERTDQLAQQNNLLGGVLSSMAQGVAAFSADLKLISWNQNFIDTYDYPKDIVTAGVSLEKLLKFDLGRGEFGDEGGEETVAARIASARSGEEISSVRLRPNGEYIEIRSRNMAGGGTVMTFTNITERKLGEEAVANQAALLNNVLENVTQGICAFDKEFRLLACNQNFQRIFSYPDRLVKPGQELSEMAQFSAEAGLFGPGDAGALAEQRLQTVKSGIPLSGELTTSDGRTYLSVVQPSPGGGFVVTHTDIAEQKEAEEAISRARDAAEDATRSKSAFLAAMSHEIRTPMNGVVGMIDLLRETELDTDQRQMMTTVRDSAYSLLHIINDILDFSKIEAGKLDLEELPISLRDAVEGVVDTLTPIAEKKAVRLSSFIDPQLPPWVLADQVRIRQILFNLAGNAVKFTEVTEGKEAIVDVSAKLVATDGDRVTVRFAIKDTGIGMTEAQIARLFEPFTQAEGSTTRRFGGTGLGLTICKNLTEIMGGGITATSVPGEGSVFAVEVTFQRDDQRPAPLDEPDLTGVQVLMLTGAPDAHRRYETYLTAWRADVSWALTPDQCADSLLSIATDEGQNSILLIGSDIELETRQSLIKQLRGRDDLTNLRFVVMSHSVGEQFGMVQPDQMLIRDRPLKRSALIHGVAVAVGRASPELVQEVERIGVEAHEVPSVEQARAAGQLILLAEDNPTNQDVISRQLNRLGYQLEVADDGEIALEMWRNGEYGLLLTDCHMPNMDGYELTGAIRDAQIENGERLPIIAITANALQGEAETCLEAGMDDYLSKPVEMRLLKRTLAKWLPRNRAHIESSVRPAVLEPTFEATKDRASGTAAPVDPSAIKDMFGDDDELVVEILCEFVEPAASNVAEILAAWEVKDTAGVGAGAHKLKSSSRTVGAHVMADLCTELEEAAKEGDIDAIEERIGDLEPKFAAVREYILELTLA